MFSRLKYINYPAAIRKKMLEREKQKQKKKKSVIKIILIVILALILLFFGAVAFSWYKGRSAAVQTEVTLNTDDVVLKEAPVVKDSGKTVTYKGTTYYFNENMVSFAFIGIDKESLGLKDGVVGTGGQSDTIAVLAYDTATGKSKILVVPRETMVDVNTYDVNGGYLDIKKMQICLAYAYGDGGHKSCENAMNSINRLLFGMQVNHYVALDLDGIAAVNDAVGGVEVTSLETIDQFTKGETVTLHGDMAKRYVKSRRKDVVDADTARRARQKQYVEAFAAKTVKMVKKDFTVVPDLWSFASSYMVTDLNVNDVTYLATVALRKSFALGEFNTVPGTYAMGETYAEYTADADALFELVLNTFYTK